MTFKEFLLEIDVGDSQLVKQHVEKQRDDTEYERPRDEFRQQMTDKAPSKGDAIKTNTGYFIITNMSTDGIHVKQAGGNKTTTIPHGTKFKRIKNTASGKPTFEIIR